MEFDNAADETGPLGCLGGIRLPQMFVLSIFRSKLISVPGSEVRDLGKEIWGLTDGKTKLFGN